VQYLAPCLNPVVLDDPPDRDVSFHQVFFEFRGKPPDGRVRYSMDQHVTAPCPDLDNPVVDRVTQPDPEPFCGYRICRDDLLHPCLVAVLLISVIGESRQCGEFLHEKVFTCASS
jgi:hypothetical protein